MLKTNNPTSNLIIFKNPSFVKVVGTFTIPMAEIAQPPAQMPSDRGARTLLSIWLVV